MSNNSSRSVDQYVAKLHKMNIPCTSEDVLLSTRDLLAWLQKEGVTKTWAIAIKGMCQMMEDVGISTRDNDPEYVVLGYDTEIDYENLDCFNPHASRSSSCSKPPRYGLPFARWRFASM